MRAVLIGRAIPSFALTLLLAACGSSERSGPHVVVGVAGIAAGGLGSCAVGGTGSLACWGAVPDGTPTDTSPNAIPVSLGARTVTVAAPLNAIALSKSLFGPAGCVVAETGQTYCWGNLIVDADQSLSMGGGLTALAGATSASSVAIDVGHLCVTRTDNVVRCFGEFAGGARGSDSVDLSTNPAANLTANSLSPALAAFGTAQGQQFGCALRTDSLIACWGERNFGQTGGASSDTVQHCGGVSVDWCQRGPGLIIGGAKYRQLSAAADHACATRITGEVDCWGSPPGGPACASAAACATPTQVALPGSAVRVVVGFSHACALLSNGAAYCWGDNTNGQLGRTGASSATPVAVSGGYLFVNLSAGADHTCGIEAGSGAVGCWGANDHGQLGDGTLIDRDRPVAVISAQ